MPKNGRSISLSQEAYEQIKQKIVSLELAPGSVIDEAALQAELELGRTPIREALQRLALEKLVLIVPRRGMFVTEIGVMDLQRLCEVRIELEGLAARLAAQRGSSAHWQQMNELLANVSNINDPHILLRIDQNCHEIIYDAADNEFLKHTLVTMYALSMRLWYFALLEVGDMRSAITEHVAILDALKNGDPVLAGSLSEHHVRHFQEEIQAVMLGLTQPSPLQDLNVALQ